jgi:hypothetical protein
MRRLPKAGQVTLEQRLEHHAEGVERGTHTHEDQDDREHLAGVVERSYLAEPHRRDRGDRLVDGIEHREPEDDVADRSEHEDTGEHRQREARSSPVEHTASLRTSPAVARG